MEHKSEFRVHALGGVKERPKGAVQRATRRSPPLGLLPSHSPGKHRTPDLEAISQLHSHCALSLSARGARAMVGVGGRDVQHVPGVRSLGRRTLNLRRLAAAVSHRECVCHSSLPVRHILPRCPTPRALPSAPDLPERNTPPATRTVFPPFSSYQIPASSLNQHPPTWRTPPCALSHLSRPRTPTRGIAPLATGHGLSRKCPLPPRRLPRRTALRPLGMVHPLLVHGSPDPLGHVRAMGDAHARRAFK
ncbi:hypothetical protein C8Q80DRAFT_26919 [Daedaleopsis nitida]|nr:hypothetical protein C8Q80DRAFT_26919 [Daedaleopsis nitida]